MLQKTKTKTRSRSKKKALSVKECRHILRNTSYVLDLVSFLVTFFFFCLTLNGGWDDLRFVTIFLMPLFAVISILISVYNHYKFKSDAHELYVGVFCLAISSAFIVYVIAAMSIMHVNLT